ncbi:MAG TPA: hypothetical protein VFO16_07365, partial [Pseudonocardiaceae bacterium]|nr:hypothetical protein [Pseudonocardiaceae bacterium]
ISGVSIVWYASRCSGMGMSTTWVTITIDEGVYQDAVAVAAEHGMSVSAWISRCTRLETMRDALARHARWCAAAGLTGPAYDQQRAQLIVGAVTEMDRLSEARRDSGDAA